MRSNIIIASLLFITILFSQAEKGKDQSRTNPKKFCDGLALEPIKNKTKFQNRHDSNEIFNIPDISHQNKYSGNNHIVEDDIIFEQGISIPARQYNPNRSIEDTLAYDPPGGFGGQFIMGPGDAMLMTFKVPTDGIVKGINIPVYEWGTGDQELTISLHKLQYPYDINGNEYPNEIVDGNGWIGGYDMDSTGIYISGDVYTPGGTQGSCDSNDIVYPHITDPLLAAELGIGPPNVPPQGVVWPDSDNVVIMTPQTHPDYRLSGNLNNWINLQDFGDEYVFQCGEWIGILFQFTGEGGGDDETVGFFYAAENEYVNSWPFLKFYNGCGGTSGNGGWHIRHWIIRTELAVELIGDRPPVYEICPLYPIFPPSDRTACIILQDDNPSGGSAGIDSVFFMYAIDSLTALWNSIEMYLVDGDSLDGKWECVFPEQMSGAFIYWYITFIDVGNSICYSYSNTPIYSFYDVEPSPGNDLIFNNQDMLYDNILYSSYLYFYWGGEPFDIWDATYGPLSAVLLNNYSTVIELTGNGGPIYNNDSEVENWWDGSKAYIVTGDEWLGIRYGWENDIIIPEGDVARSILGVDTYYPDINYITEGDQKGISRLIPDSVGILSILYNFLSDSLFLNYDPQFETGNNNCLDGFEVVDGYTVDMTAYSGVLNSNGNVLNDAEIYNVMTHGQQNNGGKSAFLSFDPIALNTMYLSYYWIGAADYALGQASLSPLVQAYENLFGMRTVGDNNTNSGSFSLKGNYPNPFNPVTNIQFELHRNTHVEITIYDVLGREVKKLVSGELVSGYHKAIWNGTNDHGKRVSAGVYLYQIRAGDFVQTKKMVLLK